MVIHVIRYASEVFLWLSVNRMYHTSIQIYTVETDLTKEAECHVFIIITVISLNYLLTMFATRDFVFVSEFPGMVRGGTTSHLFCLGEM